MTFDIKTLYISAAIVSFIFSMSMLIMVNNSKNRYVGIGDWIISIFLIAIGTFLISLRDVIWPIVSIYVANTLIIIGFMMIIRGFSRFMGLKQHYKTHIIVSILTTTAFLYYTIIDESLQVRNFIIGITGIYAFGFILYHLYYEVSKYYRHILRFFETVTIAYVVLSFVRVVYSFIQPSNNNDLFSNQPIDIIITLVMVSFTIIVPMSMLIVINKRALDEIQVQELKFENAFYDSPVIMVITRLSNGQIYDVNKAFTEILEFEKDEVIGKTTIDLNIWEYSEKRKEAFKNLSDIYELETIELKFRSKSGKLIDTLYHAKVIKILGELFILSQASDIRQLSTARKELEYMATHDALTGLLNRHELNRHFIDLANNYDKNKRAFSLIMIDLDKFKPINDTYGHDFGDKVLIQVAKYISAVFKNEFVARLGGDEFIVLIKDEVRQTELIKKMMHTRQLVSNFTSLENKSIQLGASLGYAIYPEDGNSIESLIQIADQKMYEEKLNKRR